MMHRAYNLCDLELSCLNESIVRKMISTAVFHGVEMIRTGSYFCANYFLYFMRHYFPLIAELAENAGIKISLAVPVSAQNVMQDVCFEIKAAEFTISEIVVNDYGMMRWAVSELACPVVMGRLFMRQTRDPRYAELFCSRIPIPFSKVSLEKYRDKYRVRGIEMEGFGSLIDAGSLPEYMTLYLHRPWILMSCGRICEDASISLPLEKKFRTDLPCSLECEGMQREYSISGAVVIKRGKAVFFYQEEEPEIDGVSENIDICRIDFPVIEADSSETEV